MRVVFFGTPEFAVPSLEALASKYDVVLVVTRTDKPAGRGKRLTPPPVKITAQRLGLELVQVDGVDEGLIARIREVRPEICVVNAFGLFLPRALRRAGGKACINAHPSLLPRYRGAAPIQRAIINGEKVTGVSIMHVAPKLDAGDIILQEEVPIGPDDTTETLSERLSLKAAQLLVKAVNLFEQGEPSRIPQDPELVTWADPLTKEDGRIRWDSPARNIRNLVRGMVPWPVAFTALPDGRMLKVYPQVEVVEGGDERPGTVISIRPYVVVQARDAGIRLGEVQLPGKRRVPAGALVNSGIFSKGMVLG